MCSSDLFPSHDSFVYRLNGTSTPSAAPTFKNAFGFSRADLAYKLLSYLGYGNFIKTPPTSGNRWWSTSLKVSTPAVYTQNYIQNNVVNMFPLLAYQKIYQDFSVGLSGKTLIHPLIMWITFLVFLLILFRT